MTAQYNLFQNSIDDDAPKIARPERSSSTNDRLFVPLATAPFEWFASGRKQWELRRLRRQFTRKNLVVGRRVEFRRGYQKKFGAIWGTIADVHEASSISEFFSLVDYHLVIPIAQDLEEATWTAQKILGTALTSLIGFRVVLDPILELPLQSEYMSLVRQGMKHSTIRRGARSDQSGIADLVSGDDRVRVVVTDLTVKRFEDLSDADALRDGFRTLAQLENALRIYYPHISPTELFTIIGFRPLNGR